MPISRYSNRFIFNNKNEMYKSIMYDKGLTEIRQYGSRRLGYPNKEQMRNITKEAHIVVSGDRLSTLATKAYGDPELWWVIGWFNQKPGDFALTAGETIYIPMPLDYILTLFGF